MPVKRYQRKRKHIVVDEDTAHGADGIGIGNAGGKWSGRRQQGDPAKRRAKPTKEPSMKTQGAKVEEVTKEDRFEDSMFVPTDEQGWPNMLLVRARPTQHDEEVNLRTFIHLKFNPPSPSRGVFPPRPLHKTVGPPSNPISTTTPPNHLRDIFGGRRIPLSRLPLWNRARQSSEMYQGNPTQRPDMENRVSRSPPTRTPSYDLFSAPAMFTAPSATSVGWIGATLPCHATSCNHSATNVGLMEMESESGPASTAHPAVSRAVGIQPYRHWTG